MKREELVAAAEVYAAAKNAHDLDAVVEAYAPSGFYRSAGFGEPVRGHAALRQFYGSLFSGLPDYKGEFDGVAYGEDTAVAWGRFRGTTAGDFLNLGVKPGRAINVPVMFVCTFSDGKLLSDVGYFDSATLAEQLGIRLEALRPTIAATFVPRYEAYWSAPDPDLLPRGSSEDMCSTWVGRPERIVGLGAYQNHLRKFIEPISEMSVKAVDFLAEGDVIFIEFEATCTVDGQRVQFTGLDRFRFRDGLVCDGLTMYDETALKEAIAARETSH